MKPEPKMEPLLPQKGSVEHYMLALVAALLECGHTVDDVRAGFLALSPRTPPSADVREPTEAQAVFAFLLGEGELDGVSFGDRHPTAKGAFWWRTPLRAALAAPSVPDLAPADWPLPENLTDLADIIRIERGKAYEFAMQQVAPRIEAVRREAIEQAAKVADWHEARWHPKPGDVASAFANGSAETARKIATVIRELPSQPAEETK